MKLQKQRKLSSHKNFNKNFTQNSKEILDYHKMSRLVARLILLHVNKWTLYDNLEA